MSEYIVEFGYEPNVGNSSETPIGERIVRCRDCKHHELQGVSYSDKPFSVCTAEWCEGSEHDNPLVEPNGFCAWGERKVMDR